MRTARLIVVGLVVAVLAAVIAQYVQPGSLGAGFGAGKPKSEVVIAARQLPAGHRLAEEDLAREPLTTASEASGGYTMTSAIVGRTLTVPLEKGQLVRESDLAARGSGAAIASQLPPGQRAIAVTLRDTGAGVVLYPGAFVDVLATIDRPARAGAGRDTVTRTVLERARVLAVNQEAVGARPSLDDAAKRAPATALRKLTVTLAATPEQAAQLELAAARGTIGICLRSDADGDGPRTGTAIATTESLLGPEAMPEPEPAPAPPPKPVVVQAPADAAQADEVRKSPAAPARPRVWEVTVVRGEGIRKLTFPEPEPAAKPANK